MPLQKADAQGASEIAAFEDVVKIYEGKRVLDGLTFSLRDKENLSILGESTSGKTTILKLIVGLVKPDAGVVRLFGEDINRLPEKQRVRLRLDVGMQFQSGALFDSLSVKDNLLFVLDEETKLGRREKEAVIERLLKGVNLYAARDKFPHELSGGMKKRVAVARALAATPRMVVFDEPASGLDPVTTARIVNLIKELVAENPMTMMAATTDVHLAKNFGHRIVMIKDGRVHADGQWAELKAAEDDYTQRFLSREVGA